MPSLWPDYFRGGNEIGLRTVVRAWWNQRILRINSQVPWPVHPTTTVKRPDLIQRGTRAPGLSVGCYLDARNGIEIGQNVWIGPYVRLISMNHNVNDYADYVEAPPISISDDCWLGAGATLLPGVMLGPHTVVGAGAVVTRSFPEGNCVIAGNPARIVRSLPPYAGGVATPRPTPR